MPGYKRIVSYIYTYDGGERKENTGFAKLEARDGECRIAIRMKGVYFHGQPPYKAYLYAAAENGIRGIYLGELESRNGALEWKGSLWEEDLERMPYALDKIRGVFIEGSGGKRYASEWNDHPVKVDSFRVYEESREEGDSREQLAESEAEEASWGTAVAEETEPVEDTAERGAPEEPLPEKAVLEEPEEIATTEVPQEAAAAEESEGVVVAEKPQNSLESMGHESPEPVEEPGNTEKGTVGKTDHRQEKWEYLARRFPVQKLFQKGKAPMACIRIGPRDLQRLPRGSWILGNNSFLLHGYYQYRHLLLCRQEEAGEMEYYLAVPGVYNEKEQMMANLFGFEEFHRITNGGSRNGNFGYWFRRIEENVRDDNRREIYESGNKTGQEGRR